ncbi:PREDICTED: transcription factor ABORTED MICROSPORES-like isoform X2 [Tarenaya hassleriana]|nr:PREDICTED: transcription factor ABORTED MICROSPORES-like isoform X2 [Tarenaya hassleriana]XP_010526887.1 PREDICTED: transcription factor ABORTED MICROSPORES-like isoform X2 [Tarenaya hassleriana]XP_010526889.1 PREDICTED: transcription factor ABORTED MICROSPORES-like isoform X2 [Tarenaya hassleriana]XP_010526890.1 PREDICTED: transcription factor ABORTED MICROSPORES-like isoform X2 [Tarenaya hassleriana]
MIDENNGGEGFLPNNKQMDMDMLTEVAEDDVPLGMEALTSSMGNVALNTHHVAECGNPSLPVKEQQDVDDEEEQGENQMMAERMRMRLLNDNLYKLRSLIPNVTKLDRKSIMLGAIDYIKKLQKEVKELQEELEKNSDTEDGSDQHRQGGGMSSVNGADNELMMKGGGVFEPQVELAMVKVDGSYEFSVKVICEYKPGGFTKLMEALDSLELVVINANTTRSLDLVSNVFMAERKDGEMVQVDHVKDSQLQIT